MGMVSPRLFPPKPWQALQTSAFCAPGPSSGPARAAELARSSAPRAAPRSNHDGVRIAVSFSLPEDVVPDAGPPRERVLGDRDGGARGELLLDLDNLAGVDAVGVDDGDGLPVADPAVAGVAGSQERRLLPVQEMDYRRGADLARRVRDVARLRDRQPGGGIAQDVDARLLHRLEGDVVHLAPAVRGLGQPA